MKLYGIRNKETNAFVMIYNRYVDGQMIYTDLILSTENEKLEEDLLVSMHKDHMESLLKEIQKLECYNSNDISVEIVMCRELLEVVEIVDLNVNIGE